MLLTIFISICFGMVLTIYVKSESHDTSFSKELAIFLKEFGKFVSLIPPTIKSFFNKDDESSSVMSKEKKERLEKEGWKVGGKEDFLNDVDNKK